MHTQYTISTGEIQCVWAFPSPAQDYIDANSGEDIAFIEGSWDVSKYLIIDGKPVEKTQ